MDYAILGDDIVIANQGVAEAYIKLLQEFDMEYSPDKTYVSKDSYCFAKRYFHKGSEITGFPVGALRKM